MIPALALALVSTASLGWAPQDPLHEVSAVRTKHYELILDMQVAQREDWAKLVEVAWKQYRKILGDAGRTKPGKKPRLRFYSTREHWLQGMAREEQFPLPGVNFVHFSSERDTIYLHREQDRYHERKMMLYGLFLQFHHSLKAKNQYLGQEWFVTGMADALSSHNWNGKTLELGTRHLLAENNRASLAIARGVLERLGDLELSLDDMSDWDIRWALTAFLLFGEDGAYRESFEKLALGQSGSMLLGTDFLAGLGNPGTIAGQLDAWIREQAKDFHVVAGLWKENGGVLSSFGGDTQPTSLALADRGVSGVEARVDLPEGAEGGLIIDWIAPSNYTLAIVRDDVLRIWRQALGSSEELDVIELERGECKLRAVLEDHTVTVFAQGKERGEYEVQGNRLGLAVTWGRVSFDELTQE